MNPKAGGLIVWQAVLLLAWVLWLGWGWLNQPLVVDELVFLDLARKPLTAFSHPPGYHHLLGLLHLGFGVPDFALRLVGVACLGIAAFSAVHFAEKLQPGCGGWVLLLLMTNPLALRGFFVMDIDNTVLTAWAVSATAFLACAPRPFSARTGIALGLWWAMGLWFKFTTPWLWPVVVFAAALGDGCRRALRITALMAASGLGSFLLAWVIYSHWAGIAPDALVSGRLAEMLSRGATDQGMAAATELGERAVRIGLWIGPLSLLAWGAATGLVFRGWKTLSDRSIWLAVLVFGWGMLIGYWLIGGVIWSLARYHSPFIPLMSAAVAAMLARLLKSAQPSVFTVIGCAALSFVVLVVWDPLYLVNAAIRQAFLSGDAAAVRQGLIVLAKGQLLLLAAAAAAFAILRFGKPRKGIQTEAAILLALVCSAAGANAGLLMHQRAAVYSTSYCYGRPLRTFFSVERFVLNFHEKHPNSRILAPFDTLQRRMPAEDFAAVFVNESYETGSLEHFLSVLRNPNLGLCVLDTDFSSSAAIRRLWRHPAVQALLQSDFDHVILETAHAWVRKGV